MKRVFLAMAAVLFVSGVALGEVPQVMGYQGRITDNAGNPVSDGTYTMRFRIYDNAGGSGSPLWDSGNVSVQFSGGTFDVMLGESPQPAITLAFEQDYWMLVTFDGEDQGPPNRMGSVGYAYMASGLVPGTVVMGSVHGEPAIKGHNTDTSGESDGLHGRSDGDEGIGVYGWASSTWGETYGGLFRSDASPYGTGIRGDATATTGPTYGVYGRSTSTAGTGVYGWSSASWGDTYGVYGMSVSPHGMGVCGKATATSEFGTGVFGESAADEGFGVYGQATHPGGYGYGGYFRSLGSSGTGVYGGVSATTGTGYGVHGQTATSEGAGVYGLATNVNGEAAYGVQGKSDTPSGVGVWGEASHTSSTTYGGRFYSNSPYGAGVHGVATATTGPTYGGRFESASTSGLGVYGNASATDGPAYGVYGRSASTFGRGVNGYASATTGSTYGGCFESVSTGGIGVAGHATGTAGCPSGVYGWTSAPLGSGVLGFGSSATGAAYGVEARSASSSGYGVWAVASNPSGTNYGIFAYTSSASGYAGYFDDRVHVNGTLTKLAGSFLIDHPLDPENKLLRHNFVESPENLLIYRGKVRLDPQGEAMVELPRYFKALAKEEEATITLTPIGKPFLMGYDLLSGHGAFVAYGEPNRELSWVVYADRDDPVMRQLARPVEEDKGPENEYCDRGKLLQPTAYGYPESMGRDYELHERDRQRMEGQRARMEEERARMDDERARMADVATGPRR